MIARLSGTLAYKSPEQLIVDVHGVGYQVSVSLNAFYQLPEAGQPVQLQIHTHVREDALQLFGFIDRAEKELFLLLVGVSGIGPKLALNILSGRPADELKDAIQRGDLVRLTSVPGVGKKTAERLVLELRDKIRLVHAAPAAEPQVTGGVDEEAVSALVNLGYRQAEAERSVKAARAAGASDIQSIIRDALRRVAS